MGVRFHLIPKIKVVKGRKLCSLGIYEDFLARYPENEVICGYQSIVVGYIPN